MKEGDRDIARAVLNSDEERLEPINGVPMCYVGFERNFSFYGEHPGIAIDMRNVMASSYDIAPRQTHFSFVYDVCIKAEEDEHESPEFFPNSFG